MKAQRRTITTFAVVTISLFLLICALFFNKTLAQAPQGYTVTGDLKDDTGKPLSDASVCAIPFGDGVVNVRDKICAGTDTQGKFVIHLDQAGKYQIVGEKRTAGYMPSYIPFYRNPRVPMQEIVVGEHSTDYSVSVTVGPKSGLVTGKVIDEATDKPIQDFVVRVWQVNDAKADYREVVKGTNSPGRFRLFAPSVAFRLRVTSTGYEDWTMGGGVLISKAGPIKGPGAMVVPSTSTAEFAVYMKRRGPPPDEVAKADDANRLPAPAQINPADNTVIDSFPRTMRIEWAPVEEAASYGFEVESCLTRYLAQRHGMPDDGECVNPSPFFEKFGVKETSMEFMFRGAQPGRWRVWAIDKDGRPGLKSPWWRFVHLK